MTNITEPLIEAVRSLFETGTGSGSFNDLVTGEGFPELAIDWTSGGASVQYFEGDLTPSQLEESDEFKYPTVMLYGATSTNTHEFEGQDFSGFVNIEMRFAVTNDANKPSPAFLYLHRAGSAIEDACNELLRSSGWPQDYGVPGAVAASWPMKRSKPEGGGGAYRQEFTVFISFNRPQ